MRWHPITKYILIQQKRKKKKGEIRLQVLCVGQGGGENEVAIVTPGLVRAFPGKQYLPINQKRKGKKRKEPKEIV